MVITSALLSPKVGDVVVVYLVSWSWVKMRGEAAAGHFMLGLVERTPSRVLRTSSWTNSSLKGS
jgi:hypothetical protein